MINGLVRETCFTTFDGALSLSTAHQRPDRYSHLELPDCTTHRIARGGGYSYAAASFGENSLVQEMTRFDRFLAFDADKLTLKLEAGVRLIELMEWALQRRLHFPVMPGYPLITVGGCVASDVHGKNPYKDGTFSDWVKQLTVFHPQKGYQSCSPEENPELFAMTCGGYGLTGVITDVTLQLAELASPWIAMSQKRVNSIEEAERELSSCDADIAYSWHDIAAGSNFGRGIVYIGHWTESTLQPQLLKYRPMTATTRARLPVSAWNGVTARAANSAMFLLGRYKKDISVTNIQNATFPFASNVYFHKLFGKPGLRESQFLVNNDKVGRCAEALKKLVCETGAPSMMLGLKRFKGVQKSLSMSGTGYTFGVTSYFNAKTDVFMRQLDQLIFEMGGQPNLSKDSRIPESVAKSSIANFAGFKQRLFAYDEQRTMRSELSRRLGLL